MARFTAVAALLAVCCLMPPPGAAGQDEVLKFEVATIKQDNDVHVMGIGPGLRNGTFHAQQVTVRHLIASAFGMAQLQILSSQPMSNDRFDILAKAPEGVSDEQMKPMLHELLKERFHLEAHTEERQMAIYLLTSPKGRIEARPSQRINDTAFLVSARPSVISGLMTTARLAAALTDMLERPVIDKTGLSGRQRISLLFARPQANEEPGEFHAPDIITALREQLGLSLKPTRGAVEVLIVDHVERTPTEN